jgi:integrase
VALRPWRGSILSIRGRLYLQVRDGAGRWRQRALKLDDTPANRLIAEERMGEVRVLLKAREDAGAGDGAVTVRAWGTKWLAGRKASVRDHDHDGTRLRLHVYPVIGSMPLDEVRPRHLVDLVNRLRADGKAPRTVRNVYSVVKAMFRDARIADVLTAADPCILTHRQMGKVKDSPKFSRAAAVFTADELAALVFDPRVPDDRRAWYALLGVGMLRTGEAAGLRWGSVQRAEPLGRLVVSTSYDHGMTKTDVIRWMPIHPALASILEAWRLGGWARTFGRPPTDDDLVVPVPAPKNRGPRKLAGSMRDRHWARKRMVADFAALGLRHRRAHDLRRTGISLAQDGGADSRVLRWGTHAPPGETIDGYTSLAWTTLSRAVSMMLMRPAAERTSKDTDPG